MERPEDLIDLLNSYLEGQLSATEKSSLEAKLQVDPNLRQQMEELKLLKMGIRNAARLRIRSQVSTAMKTVHTEAYKRPRRFGGRTGLYFALAVLGMLVFFLLMEEKEPYESHIILPVPDSLQIEIDSNSQPQGKIEKSNNRLIQEEIIEESSNHVSQKNKPKVHRIIRVIEIDTVVEKGQELDPEMLKRQFGVDSAQIIK